MNGPTPVKLSGTERPKGTCWCGKKAYKGWTTCPRHYSSGRAR